MIVFAFAAVLLFALAALALICDRMDENERVEMERLRSHRRQMAAEGRCVRRAQGVNAASCRHPVYGGSAGATTGSRRQR